MKNFCSRLAQSTLLLCVLLPFVSLASSQDKPFNLLEATIESIHAAYRAGELTSRQLVQLYLNHIEAYDQKGPKRNAIITVNPQALEEADRLDAAYKGSGPVGLLHGIPIILKDQIDAKGMPTTMGSVLFKDYLTFKRNPPVQSAGGGILVGETICLIASASCILSMQRVGDLHNKGAIGSSRKDTVGKAGLVVNDVKVVNRAEDVVEAYLKSRQFTLAVVLEKSRGE